MYVNIFGISVTLNDFIYEGKCFSYKDKTLNIVTLWVYFIETDGHLRLSI